MCMLLRTVSPVVLLALVTVSRLGAAQADEGLGHDEKQLNAAGVGTDGPALLAYFRQRTLTEDDRQRLAEHVRLLGSRTHKVRERATSDLIRAGRLALPVLRPALTSSDPETARRAARCVRAIEDPAAIGLIGAAARVLAARQPDGAAQVLLAYLPSALDETIEQEVGNALLLVGLSHGKARPPLLAALTDPDPLRRAAAASAVGRATDPVQRRKAAGLLTDPDSRVRFHAAASLLASGERQAGPILIAALTDAPPPLAWQAEDLLYRAAGDKAPAAGLGAADAEARRRCRAAWDAWWKTNGKSLDLAALTLDGRPLGLTLVCEAHLDDGGRVFECGPDGRPRWTVKAQNPIDAQLLPGSRVLIADCNANQVVEVDPRGKVLWTHKISSPLCCRRLPGGTTFIATYTTVTEVTRDGKTLYEFTADGQNYYACKLPGGNIVTISSNGLLRELDRTGKEVRRTQLEGNRSQSWACIEPLPGGHVLVALGGSGKVMEIDLSGKVYWERAVKNPNSATRLSNGHTLVASHDDHCVYEFDRNGREVWRRAVTGHPFRARRR
jgi:HEAT repeat protein